MWIIFSIISCVLAAIMQILNKKILIDMDSLTVTFIKNGFVFLFSFWIIFSNKTRNKIFSIDIKTFLMIIVLAIITFLTYLFGFKIW